MTADFVGLGPYLDEETRLGPRASVVCVDF